jgi:tRNA threonylcarbamoyl adenosine modification protein YeaZ/ribosomal-protein-alanine acetyltransferase
MAGVADAEEGSGEVVTSGNCGENAGSGAEYNIAAVVVLALETVTRAGSLALHADGTWITEADHDARAHGTRLPGALAEIAARAARRLRDIDVFAVVTGPGSFTGIRIGLAAVQGAALTTGRPVAGIPTFDAFAEAWRAGHPGDSVHLTMCMDAARGDVFFASAEIDATADTLRWRVPASVAAPDVAAERLGAEQSNHPRVLAGDAVERYQSAWEAAFGQVLLDAQPPNLALGAGRIALRTASLAEAPHRLRPLYVRRPDAVLARERARGTEAAKAAAEAPAVTVARAITREELGDVAALQRRSFTNAWGAEAIQWELEHTDVARLYTARVDGRLVGYCACWIVFDELHINSIAIDDAWRRRGVARALLTQVFRDAFGAGARMATLEVRQSNTAARHLYENLGFAVEGVRRNYYQDPREDGLILWHRRLADFVGH